MSEQDTTQGQPPQTTASGQENSGQTSQQQAPQTWTVNYDPDNPPWLADRITREKEKLAKELGYTSAEDALKAKKQDEKRRKEEQPELERLREDVTRLTPLEQEAASLREKLTAYEQAEEKRLKTMLEGIPKEKHKLIPDGLSTPQKLAWLEVATAEGVFAPNKPRPQGNLDAGAGTGGTENNPIPPDDIKRRLRIGGN